MLKNSVQFVTSSRIKRIVFHWICNNKKGDMMRVKVFQEEDEEDLSEVINTFLQEHADIRVCDIKLSTDILEDEEDTLTLFTVLLIYL